MSIVLIGGFLFFVVLLLKKSIVLGLFSQTGRVAETLAASAWFEHVFWSGLFLFLANAGLFGMTWAALISLSYFFIPYLHLLVIVFAILASIFLWTSIYHADKKPDRQRLAMGWIGSSFYLILLGVSIFRIFAPEIDFNAPEQDQFMEFIGMLFFGFVAFTAWFTCLVITGVYRKNK